MTGPTLIHDLIIILISAFLGGIIAKRLKAPVTIGFLLAGFILKTFFSSNLFSLLTIQSIAEIGVALLLFTIGLEINIAKLRAVGDVIILGSLIQVSVFILVGMISFPYFGFDFYSSLFLAAAFSLSSTAIAIKVLIDRGELDTLHGEMSTGWLFLQDLYTLPMMIILPSIGKLVTSPGQGTEGIFALISSIGISFGLFLFILISGNIFVPKIMEFIANLKSRELLVLSAVSLCLLFAFAAQAVGISPAVGAFLAGVLLSSSSANHGIFAEIRPLRDLFSTVFFVSLGFMINPQFLQTFWPQIIIISILIILTKFIVSAFLVIIFGYHTKTAVLVGFSLTSVGEFAFILSLLGRSLGLISLDTSMMILAVSFVTLLASIPIFASGERFYYAFKPFLKKIFPHLSTQLHIVDRKSYMHNEMLRNHVVVLGHGRVGSYICKALLSANIPYVVVDYNHHLVKSLRKKGMMVIYGDPMEIDVLRFANVETASVVILAYADRHAQEIVISNVLTLNPKATLICRVHFEKDLDRLQNLGAHVVVQPEFEAAVSIVERLLYLFNRQSTEIDEKIRRLRKDHAFGTA